MSKTWQLRKRRTMKQMSFVLTIPLLLLCGSAFGQPAGPLPQAPQLPPGAVLHTPKPASVTAAPAAPASFSPAQWFRYYTVQGYMKHPSPLQLGDQLLAGMGDEAASDILITLGTAPPLSAAQMQTAMDIVHKAFMHPRAIQNLADRKPTASLTLLQRFQATVVDQLVKERIAAENNFLNAVPQKLPPLILPTTLGPPPAPGTTPFN